MDLTIECEERKTALDEAQNNRLSCDENGILELNVGGQLFTTTRDTLSAAGQSFFSGLISGSFGILRDSKGCVFIDRDREFKGAQLCCSKRRFGQSDRSLFYSSLYL